MEGFRDLWVRVALGLALLLPAYFLVAALGTKFHLFPWTVGFGQMTFVWGPRIILAVAALAFIGLLIALFTQPRSGVPAALIALLIPLLALGYAFYVRQQASGVPPIHDISTDLADPPGFSQGVIDARAAVQDGNALDLLMKRTGDGRAFVELQRQAYADIAPINTTLPPDRAFDVALALVREQRWALGSADAQAGVIEATAESFWYGFIDDIVIRVRPDGAGARIDMRSVSRVGRSDLGVNAARMRPFLSDLRTRLLQAEGG
jgi:uncharacterized protein (DUF1499 family)